MKPVAVGGRAEWGWAPWPEAQRCACAPWTQLSAKGPRTLTPAQHGRSGLSPQDVGSALLGGPHSGSLEGGDAFPALVTCARSLRVRRAEARNIERAWGASLALTHAATRMSLPT